MHCSGAEAIFILRLQYVEIKQVVCLSLVIKTLLESCGEEFRGLFVALSLNVGITTVLKQMI